MFFNLFAHNFSPIGLKVPFLEVTREMEETFPSAYTIIDMARHVDAVTTDKTGEEIYWVLFPGDRKESGYTQEDLKIRMRKKFRDTFNL
jgi:hypothetical protein